jgi:hypothetical protein
VAEVIVLFKGITIFKQNIPKKLKNFGTKIDKHFDMSSCAYHMNVCLGEIGKMQNR